MKHLYRVRSISLKGNIFLNRDGPIRKDRVGMVAVK